MEEGMNTLSQKSVFFVVALFSLALLCPSAGSAGIITDDLKTAVDKVLGIMQNPAYGAPDKKEERQKLINTVIAGKFDWEEMSRRALGVHWRDFTPPQQKEFVAIFSDFLERTYISKVDLFLKEEKSFSANNIVYTKETIEEQYALVDSKVALKEDEIPLSYKLINKGGKWVVYDMTLEGVGIVANYRTQFSELLANGSYEKLIQKLKSKQGEGDIIEKAPAAARAKQ
jgi:phospholipid transport system substrate-binding protein